MKYLFFIFCMFLILNGHGQQVKVWELSDIPIRDPYILPVEEENTYYLYSATHGDLRDTNGNQGVCAYKSVDLKLWEGPYIVFEYPDNFWADPNHGVWAPEVHKYNGGFYLFATFTNPKDTIEIRSDGIPVVLRGTQICFADNPLGPFIPFDLNKPTSPSGWSALDGTLWLEDGTPYMVFCQEWVQINEGTFEVVELRPDLTKFEGNPTTIFKANEASWVKRMDLLGKKYKDQSIPGYVSDGPDIHRLPSGKLICLTSGFGENGYSLSYAISESGKLTGPWKHPENPLLTDGYGHGTLFRTFDKKLTLTCHYPNTSPSKAVIYEVEELEKGIRIKDRLD